MENKNDKKTKRLALAGQLCGATLLLTLLSIPLPSGYGYVNLGDAGVFLCVCLLPVPPCACRWRKARPTPR